MSQDSLKLCISYSINLIEIEKELNKNNTIMVKKQMNESKNYHQNLK